MPKTTHPITPPAWSAFVFKIWMAAAQSTMLGSCGLVRLPPPPAAVPVASRHPYAALVASFHPHAASVTARPSCTVSVASISKTVRVGSPCSIEVSNSTPHVFSSGSICSHLNEQARTVTVTSLTWFAAPAYLTPVAMRLYTTSRVSPFCSAVHGGPVVADPASVPAAPVSAVHPPDLETDDPSLATEVLPAPPPLASITGQRRASHLRRPAQVFSYLPATDPGSTYTGLMGGLGLVLVPEDEGRLRKRARTDKSTINNRAQRASARSLNPTVAHGLLPPQEASTSDSFMAIDQPDARPGALRRPNSIVTLSDELLAGGGSNGSNRPRARDKGKGKAPAPSVKEEPEPQAVSIPLDMLEPGPPPTVTHQPNDDHCSSCRSDGGLLYCDGCPRSFHLWCLDPPMDAQDVPEGDTRWYCPACLIQQNPPPKPRRSLLAPFFNHLQMSVPTEFELPEDIRGFLKGVATGPKGSYQNSTELKQSRARGFNILGDRDPFRLKDKNSVPVLCFRCGKSALPDPEPSSGPSSASASTANSERETRTRRSSLRATIGQVLWKSIVSCGYCSLHWHLDCLDPPLSSMPPAHKKWLCPAHVEHVAPTRRVPKQVPPISHVTARKRPNNGNIDSIPADNAVEKSKKMKVDEVHINGWRYRIPERVVVLDFWDKLDRRRRPPAPVGLLSEISSPLTSLSSLDDIEPYKPPPELQSSLLKHVERDNEPINADSDMRRAADLLIACRTAVVHRENKDRMDMDAILGAKKDMAVQTEPEGCVKLDIKDNNQLGGLICETLQDFDSPEPPPTGCIIVTKRNHARTANILKPVRSNPASAHRLRKSSRLPSESGSGRLTRSKVAPPPLSVISPSTQLPKTTPVALTTPNSTPTRMTRASRSLAGTSITVHTSSATSPSTPSRKIVRSSASSPTHTNKPSEPIAKSPKRLKRPASPPTSTETDIESNTPAIAPFKIRIPRAINTAVAAATTAAAAASGSISSNTPRRNDPSRSLYRHLSTSSVSSLSSVLFVPRTTRARKGDASKRNGVGPFDTESPLSSPS
ncbi:hypothetical protein K439DRAFT_1657461 [Ramaria rubella]|nr:hypothetical protein K439DRAFT_1657461 [Ramaria rubella]